LNWGDGALWRGVTSPGQGITGDLNLLRTLGIPAKWEWIRRNKEKKEKNLTGMEVALRRERSGSKGTKAEKKKRKRWSEKLPQRESALWGKGRGLKGEKKGLKM